jgi:hypothetical protein
MFQPLAGRTRPLVTTVTIPDPPQPRLQPAPVRDAASQQLAREIESASNVIAAYSDLYTDNAIRVSRTASYRVAMERSRTTLELLFLTEIDSTECALVARRARIAVLDRILIPVDSVFGRVKKVNLDRLAGGATIDFARWLSDSSGIATSARPRMMLAQHGSARAHVRR